MTTSVDTDKQGGPYRIGYDNRHSSVPTVKLGEQAIGQAWNGNSALSFVAELNRLHAEIVSLEENLRTTLNLCEKEIDARKECEAERDEIVDRAGAAIHCFVHRASDGAMRQAMIELQESLPEVEPKLPSCLHCGSKTMKMKDIGGSNWWLHCFQCRANGPEAKTKAEALAAYGSASLEQTR